MSVDIPIGRLTVVTGVSGSGKSSLAFDTLYAEGQRRYAESLSTYARQFLERLDRPDADSIEPVPPAIALEQKNGVRNARSTVGTQTEIHDAQRLLFAHGGTTHCPDCGLAAVPIFADFSRFIPAQHFAEPFPVPSDIVTADIDPDTGELAAPGCSRTTTEVFIQGTAPTTYCRVHGGDFLSSGTR